MGLPRQNRSTELLTGAQQGSGAAQVAKVRSNADTAAKSRETLFVFFESKEYRDLDNPQTQSLQELS